MTRTERSVPAAASAAAGLRAEGTAIRAKAKHAKGMRSAGRVLRGRRASVGRDRATNHQRAFGVAEGPNFSRVERGKFDGPVAAFKSGDGILIGIFALEFVSGAAVEVEFEFALRGSAMTMAPSARVMREPLSAPVSKRKTPCQWVRWRRRR